MTKEITYTLPPNGDEDQGQKYIAAAWVLVMSALISSIVRVVVRSHLTRNMGSDDWWMVVTMISNLVGLGFVTQEVKDGEGRHMYYLSRAQVENFGVIGWLDWMQTFITICFCKISICMFLLRIKNTRGNKIFMYALIACNVIVTTVVTGIFIGLCTPPNAYWIVNKPGHCMTKQREMAVVLVQGIFSALSDIVLATTPLLFLHNLQISRRTKIALCILMGAGYITAACAIVRTALSGQILETDITYAMIPNAAWRATEVNLGIICANAPILRPLYLWYRGRLQRKTSKRDGSTYVATKGSGGGGGSTGKSRVRLWPAGGSKWGGGSSSKGARGGGLGEGTGGSGYTEATAEMGLPLQGVGDGRAGSQNTQNTEGEEWMDDTRGRLGEQEWMPPPVLQKVHLNV